MIGGIVIWILLFMFLVFIHELGHFLAAKKAGVKVLEFGIWIPPKAITLFTDKSGTKYTLNRIPLWWFVRLKGENPAGAEFLDKDSFVSASLPWKLIVLAAWVVVNLIFAWIIFSASFVAGVRPITVIPDNLMAGDIQSYLMPTPTFLLENWYLSGEIQEMPVKVLDFLDESLWADAWIMSWDTITKINDVAVSNTTLWLELKKYVGKTFDLVRENEWVQKEKKITCPDENCLLWVMIESNWNQELLPIKMWIWKAMGAGIEEIVAQSKLTFTTLWFLAKNLTSGDSKKAKKSVDQLSGPVGIVKFGETILQYGWVWMYLAFGGMISLALALFNILPIPALDWGRALSVILQKILWLRPEKYFAIEWYFNFFFFVLLMLLGIYIIGMDLERWWCVDVPGIHALDEEWIQDCKARR